MSSVNVGLIGCGFAASLHADAVKYVAGTDVKIAAVASRSDAKTRFAKTHLIKSVYSDWKDLLTNPEIDIIDIATPVALHAEMIIAALKAGKNVICEKPLTGYCGMPGDVDPIGMTVSKRSMYDSVLDKVAKIEQVVSETGMKFMYAENFVYAPSVQRVLSVAKGKNAHVMMIRGEEWHSGSHAEHAARWDKSGGGVLIRMLCHPLTGALYLKHETAKHNGNDVRIKSVLAKTASLSNLLSDEQRINIAAHPYDVEDYGKLIVTFTDGTVADLSCSDFALGGTRNVLDVYSNNCVLSANMSPNTEVMGYFPDETDMSDIYLAEKLETKAGYQYIYSCEEISRGYAWEYQDFAECVLFDRQPKCGIELASETVKAIYAGYVSAEEQKEICL